MQTFTGLSEKEAERRLFADGYNQLKKPPGKTLVQRFLEQLCDPLIYLLFAAAAISLWLKELNDAWIILTVIVLNAAVGMIQEGKAEKALEKLKEMQAPVTEVIREGKLKKIESARLVRGDLVQLTTGCCIPADGIVLSSTLLRTEESAMTGESVPVEKEEKDEVYMSTNVVYGRGIMEVKKTGMATKVGKIAGMLAETNKEPTPLQKRLGELGKWLSVVALVLCGLLVLLGFIQGKDLGEMFLTAISLAVAAVPEGLPATVTIVLAMSVSRMVRVHAIVRRLPCVETLGCVGVVCSDKTGTLTKNRMTVTACYSGGTDRKPEELHEKREEEFLRAMTLCNDAKIGERERIGDPTELALLDLSRKYHFYREEQEKYFKRIGEIPFSSERKRMTTIHQYGDQIVSYTKGAADVILEHCSFTLKDGKQIPLTKEEKEHILNRVLFLSRQALRVLAFSMNRSELREENMTFLGLLGMMDPVREEAKESIERFRMAGVRTIMITGDHAETAAAIGRELELFEAGDVCITGKDIDSFSDEELAEKVKNTAVVARVSPEHKVRIVKALKKNGQIIAMTGDGTNDAPSLKAADIGIAMGEGGTDVAKNAADLILTDDNFSTIEKAIEEGRSVYENIRKAVLFLLSSNFGEIITMFAAVAAGLSAPLKASHILWVNLITDCFPALALGRDKNNGKELMARPPRKPEESLFSHGGMKIMIVYGFFIAAISLLAFLKIPIQELNEMELPVNIKTISDVLKQGDLLDRAQTYSFTVLGLSQLFHAIGMRDVNRSLFRVNHLENTWMVFAVIFGIALQVLVTEIPVFVHLFATSRLSFSEWSELIGLAATPLVMHELLIGAQVLTQKVRKGMLGVGKQKG